MADRSWRPSRKKYGVVIFNYTGRVKGSLSLNVGETVHILEEYGDSDGWYRGESLRKKDVKGIFPKCLIHIRECEVYNEGRFETITPVDDPVVRELTFGLREWLHTWKSKYLEKGMCQMLGKVEEVMISLIGLRSRLIGSALSMDQMKDIKDEVATLVDWGNSQLGMDLVPRKDGEQLDPDVSSIVELHRIHVESAENAQSAEPKRKRLVTERGSKELGSLVVNNIFVSFNSLQCNIGDESLIYISVFSYRENKFISEPFEIHINKYGFPSDQAKLNNMNALFTDISNDDLSKHLFLVARIYRYGRMLSDSNNKKAPDTPYRRPWGVGVLSMKEIEHHSEHEDPIECMMRVQSYEDNTFFEGHDHMIRKYQPLGSSSKTGATGSTPEKQNLGMTISVKILQGDLKNNQSEHHLLYNRGVTMIQKLDFSEVINPGEVRNDLYITLEEGEFEKDGKKSQKNVELKMTVYDKEGKPIPQCMSFGCGAKPLDKFCSSVYYHCNNPKWAETIRISISMDKFPGSHVRFEVYHCSRNTSRAKVEKRLCGFAFMMLTNDKQIVIKDGSHVLCLYKCENIGKIKYEKYKNMSFLSDDYGDPKHIASHKHTSMNYQRSGKETIKVRTKLCSTKFTQTSELLGILQWKECIPQIESNLNSMMELQGGEIMKFLQDILDALFQMLTDSSISEGKYSAKVFQSLVFILNLLLDSRFANFLPVLDNYLKETFSSPVVHIYLTTCFVNGIQSAISGDHFPVAMSFKVLDHLVRLIVRSRELEASSMYGRPSNELTFKRHIMELFHSFGAILAIREPRVKISQMALLSNLQRSFETFTQVITKRELAELVKDIIHQMPKSKDIADDVARNRMEFIKEIVNSDLFMEDESRAVLLPLSLSYVEISLKDKMFLQLATSTLGDILDRIFQLKKRVNIMHDIKTIASTVFQIMIETTLTLSEKSIPMTVNILLQDFQTIAKDAQMCPLPQEETCDIDEETTKQKRGQSRDRRKTMTGMGLFGFNLTSSSTPKNRPPSIVQNKEVPIKQLGDVVSKFSDCADAFDKIRKKSIPTSMEDLGLSQRKSRGMSMAVSPVHTPAPSPVEHLRLTQRKRSSSVSGQVTPVLQHQKSSPGNSTFHFPTDLPDETEWLHVDKWKGEMIACMAEMLRLMDDKHYTVVMQMFPKQSQLKEFLTKVLLTFQELIKDDIYPMDWTVMRMVTNNVIFTATEYFSAALREHFLYHEKFDQQLWSHYFNLAVAFITQPSLQLERYSDAKTNKIKERYSDMRILMGQQIQMLWENLGNNRRHFIPSMIGPFLKVTLVPEQELRKATLPIFFDMMECEQRMNKNFLLVENEIIEKLDQFITVDRHGDEEYMELFKTILLDKVTAEPELKENGSQFIMSVTSLLEKLLDYRQVYDGEEHRSKRMHCSFNILNFYKDNNNREEMYVRYIKKLYDLHIFAHNYVEAGLTLQLYAQLLQWRDNLRKEEMDYPAQPEWERKEKVYIQVIDCFDKGKVWEYGIPLCKELATFYEKRLDYRKLSKTLERQAKFFSNILDGFEVHEEGKDRPMHYPRQEPTYFRVAYYGSTFPPFVRNKAFIYRGDECLKLQDIINQLLQEFPAATILSNKTPIDAEKKDGHAQHIQICQVKPVPDDRPEFKERVDVKSEIKNFYSANDVDTFQFDRSFYNGEKDKNNEFKNLWKERTIMRTSYKFPGILQWYEVVSIETVQLSPVQAAMDNVSEACQELQKEVEKSQRNPSGIDNTKSLSMKLQGMISANVNGGIPKYQEAFLVPEYIVSHPGEEKYVAELKSLLDEQVRWLEKGLHLMKTVDKMHGGGLTELLRSLNDMFKDTKKSLNYNNERGSITSVVYDVKKDSGAFMLPSPLEPSRPSTPGGSSLQSSGSNRSSVYSADTQGLDDDRFGTEPPNAEEPRHNQIPNIPPPPEKKRSSYLGPFSSIFSSASSLGNGNHSKPPSRPHSLHLGAPAAQHLQVPTLSAPGRTGSDSNLNRENVFTSSGGVHSSVSTSHLDQSHQHPSRLPRNPSAPSINQRPQIPQRRPPDQVGREQVNPKVTQTVAEEVDIRPPLLPKKSVKSMAVSNLSQPPIVKMRPAIPNKPHVPPLPPRKGSSSSSQSIPPVNGAGNNPERSPSTHRSPSSTSSHTSPQTQANTDSQDTPPPIPKRTSTRVSSNTPVPIPRSSTSHESTDM